MATACGPFPVVTSAVTEFVSGSIRETVPSRLFATHAAPSPKAIPVGPFPTWVAPTCFPVFGSMRTTLPTARWLAHSVPAPKASSVAATGSVLVRVPLSGSILVIVPSPVFATQTEPAA